MAVIYGNANNNVLRGSIGVDSIYGLDGNDTLYGPGRLFGGAGNDTYIIYQSGAIANADRNSGIELANEGYDTLIFNLKNDIPIVIADSPNVEEYIVNGNAGLIDGNDSKYPSSGKTIYLNATAAYADIPMGGYDDQGNPFHYTIYGSSGSDTIWGSNFDDDIYGGKGADVLLGGRGNDTYEVDAKSDIVIEMGGGGYDRINCTAREYNLQINVEDLYAYGERGSTGLNFNGNVNSNHIEITGDFDRIVKSGAGDDYVSTAGGNDYLIGGTGNDTLAGGVGDDGYRTEIGAFGQDIINDIGGTNDSLELMGLNPEQLWLSQVGNDLRIYNIDSPTNNVTVKNWFSSTDARMEKIFANGNVLEEDGLRQLINVMSIFQRPSSSSAPIDAVVAQAIKADWHQ
jgi:Ca2+-binding RTX toxin-like protein